MRPFTVLIDGVGFKNRGAWLMLEAVLEQIRARLPRAVVAIPRVAFSQNPDWCREHGVSPLYRTDGRHGPKTRLVRFLSALVGCRGPVVPAEVDLLLDAAGFKYSDQFPDRTAAENREELDYYRSFSGMGRKIVLLPQAFGPFEKVCQRERLLSEFPCFDRISVRDESSCRYLQQLVGDDGRIFHEKDFTCLFVPPAASAGAMGDYAVVVPNKKMLEATRPEESRIYLGFMSGLIGHLLGKGIRVVLLNHGGARDAEINLELSKRVGGRAVVVNEPTAADCKTIIGGARLLISSRFHGVVSGLTQGVPTLCTGWSHKYRELMNDFGIVGAELSVGDLPDAMRKADLALGHPSPVVASEMAIGTYCDRARKMWNDVFALVPQDASLRPPPSVRPLFCFARRYRRLCRIVKPFVPEL